MTSMLTIALANIGWLRFFLAFLSVVALYFNGARTELFSFIFSFVAVSFLFYFRKHTLYLTSFFLLLLFVFFVPIQTVQEMLPDNRILQVFNLQEASSAVMRTNLSHDGIEKLKENPIFGSYAFYYNSYG